MINIIVRIDDAEMAANAGGSVMTHYKTFGIIDEGLELLLTGMDGTHYRHAYVVGAEVPDDIDL